MQYYLHAHVNLLFLSNPGCSYIIFLSCFHAKKERSRGHFVSVLNLKDFVKISKNLILVAAARVGIYKIDVSCFVFTAFLTAY